MNCAVTLSFSNFISPLSHGYNTDVSPDGINSTSASISLSSTPLAKILILLLGVLGFRI